MGADDALDIFAVHAIGGLIGNLCTGFFAADYIAHLDGFTVIPGGFVNGNWIQLAIQLGDSAAGAGYSFTMTSIILISMSFIGRFVPAFRLRADPAAEEIGMDDAEIGEYAYDYVEIMREVKPREPSEIDEFDDEASQRSHSQATMVLGEKRGNNIPLRDLNSGEGSHMGPYETSYHGGPIGSAS